MNCLPTLSHLNGISRSFFNDYLDTNNKRFAFFLLSTFIPGVAILRWCDVAWKISLLAPLVLTIGAKYLLDKTRPLPQIQPKRTPSADVVAKPSKILTISNLNLQNLSLVNQSPSHTPLSIYVDHLPIDELLKNLIPGSYSLKIEKKSIVIDDPNIQNAFKIWLNIQPEEPITIDDVKQLRKYVRCQDVSQELRKEIRQSLYESLYPLLKEEPIELSFMTGYEGETITLRQEDSKLIIKSSDRTPYFFELSISSNGEVCYQYYSKGKLRFSIDNEDTATIQFFNNSKKDAEGNLYIDDKRETSSIEKNSLHRSYSYVNLLNFKLDQIVGFLSSENEGQVQVRKIFQGCCHVLNSFQKSENQLSENQPTASVGNKPLATTENEIDKTTYSIGPMWSPVAASEDSSFTWHITTEQKTESVSIRLEKHSSGRGLCGGTASRNVGVSKEKDSNILKVKISKSNANDLESHASSSEYSIEDKGHQGIFIKPLGIDTESEMIPFLSGMQYSSKKDTGIQTHKKIQEDIGFITNVLFTIHDIQSSPDTVLLDLENKKIMNLLGNPIPLERMAHYCKNSSQGTGNCPTLFYNDRHKSAHFEWDYYIIDLGQLTNLQINDK